MPQSTPAMPPPRIDLSELKSQLAKRLGPERARRYFSYLHRLLSHKLSKAEFNKLCLLTIGRENVPLHNQLIQSVIKNACQAKVPPPLKNSLHMEDVLTPPHPLGWSNGDILPHSPRRRRSAIQRSKLGLNEAGNDVVQENGDLGYHDSKRHQERRVGEHAEQLVKRHRVNSNGIEQVVVGEDGEFMELKHDLKLSRVPLQAPLGIPFCPASVGGAKRSLSPVGNASFDSFSNFSDVGELCHTQDLRKRMERIVEAHGLVGVTLDCANLLNDGLDAFLKQLIRSSVELVRSSVGHETIKHAVQKQKPHGKPINGIWLDNSSNIHTSSGLPVVQERNCLITLQDFTVAMKLNPQQLGEDAQLWLEKICLRSFEE